MTNMPTTPLIHDKYANHALLQPVLLALEKDYWYRVVARRGTNAYLFVPGGAIIRY